MKHVVVAAILAFVCGVAVGWLFRGDSPHDRHDPALLWTPAPPSENEPPTDAITIIEEPTADLKHARTHRLEPCVVYQHGERRVIQPIDPQKPVWTIAFGGVGKVSIVATEVSR